MVYTSRIYAVCSLSDYTAAQVYSTVVNQAFHVTEVSISQSRALLHFSLLDR